MVGRRAVCGIGLGLGLAAAGCTPTSRLRVDPAPVSATPLQRRTSEDPDTNRILTEIGNDVLQLTVYPDRVYVTTVDRRNLVSSGGPFAIAPEAPVPDMIGFLNPPPTFPADAFLITRARDLIRANRGTFGTIGKPQGQVLMDIKDGAFPNSRTIRSALAPGQEVAAHDYWTQQGVDAGLAELLAVQRAATYSIGLSRSPDREATAILFGRAAEQDRLWFRDQYRPMTGTQTPQEPLVEAFDPPAEIGRSLLRVTEEVIRRSGPQLRTEVRAVSRNGTPVLEFYAGSDDGPRLTGTADLDGRILELR